MLVLSTINGFKLFVEPYVMTGGGPDNSTISMVHYLYKQAFDYGHMGYSATLGFALALFTLVVVLVQRKLVLRHGPRKRRAAARSAARAGRNRSVSTPLGMRKMRAAKRASRRKPSARSSESATIASQVR